MEELPKAENKSKKLNIKLAEIASLLIWLYFCVKMFVIDFDVLFIQKYIPGLNWAINYKFFILIATLLIIWLFLKNALFFKFVFFVFIYPFYLLCWRLPKLLFKSKNWIGVFAALEFLISFFKRFKFNFIMFVLIAFSILFILSTNSKYTIVPAMVVIFLYLVFYFIIRFKYAFHPFNAITIQSESMTKMWSFLSSRFGNIEIEAEKTNDNNKSNTNEPNWMNLQFILIMNHICYFLTSKLRKFKRSKIAVAYSMLGIFSTIIITVLAFGFINYGLYKIIPASFYNPNLNSLIYFFYYSFNTLFSNNINDFYPLSDLARLINCAEILFGFIIFVILVFILTTILRERHTEQIDDVITIVHSQATEIEKFIELEFKLTPIDALKEIEKIKGAMLKVIYYFIDNIEK